MANFHTITPEARLSALLGLESHPGWPLFCERMKDIVANQIDAKIFDVNTSDEERRTLVAARPLLIGPNAPEQVRKALAAVCESEIRHAKQRAERAG